MEELAAADARHDHALRAVYYLLLAASERSLSLDPPDDQAADRYQAASAALFPRGLEGTRARYLAEEGNAKLAAQVLKDDAALAKTLASLELSKKASATSMLHAYVDLGLAVGDLERRKIAAAGEGGTQPATLLKARNAWIDVVGTVARVLSHAKADVAKSLLRGVTEPAEKASKAALAAAKKNKAKTPATPPAVDPRAADPAPSPAVATTPES